MAASDNLSKALFHGTDANVEEGDWIHPVSDESPLFSTTSHKEAGNYGKHLYQVRPTVPEDLWHSATYKESGTNAEVHDYATAWPYEVVKKLR